MSFDNTSYPFLKVFKENECENIIEQHNHNSMVILGNSIDILQTFKDNTIDLIFVDAPYNIGKDFGNNFDKWNTIEDYIIWCKIWIDE